MTFIFITAFWLLPMTDYAVSSTSQFALLVTVQDKTRQWEVTDADLFIPCDCAIQQHLHWLFKRQLKTFLFNKSISWLYTLAMYCVLEAILLTPR